MQAAKGDHFISTGLSLGLTAFCIVPTWLVLSNLEHNRVVPDDGQAVEQLAAKEENGGAQHLDDTK